MKTTVDLPDPLFHKLEQAAAAQGTSPERYIIIELEKKFSPVPAKTPEARQPHRVRLPLIDSKAPGTLHLTNADIEELLA
jgi:hypothetical protein